MTPSQKQAIRELRLKGYAVVYWSPEELAERVDPVWLEGKLTDHAWHHLIPDELPTGDA